MLCFDEFYLTWNFFKNFLQVLSIFTFRYWCVLDIGGSSSDDICNSGEDPESKPLSTVEIIILNLVLTLRESRNKWWWWNSVKPWESSVTWAPAFSAAATPFIRSTTPWPVLCSVLITSKSLFLWKLWTFEPFFWLPFFYETWKGLWYFSEKHCIRSTDWKKYTG